MAAKEKIYLVGEIDSIMYREFTEKLDVLVCSTRVKESIEIELSSEGGNEDYAFAIYDRIKSCGRHVTITAFGPVQSAAILVFAAGTRRIAAKNTIFMVHDTSSKLKGSTGELLREATSMEAAENRFYSLLWAACNKKTKPTLVYWRQLSKNTTYFSAELSLRWGLADEVSA